METKRQLMPDTGHLSVFTAALALSFLIARFVHLPVAWETTLPLPGLVLSFRLTTGGIVALIIALISLGGTLGMLQRHPLLQPQANLVTDLLPHAVLPTVSAWGVEALLQRLPPTSLWALALAVGMIFILAVLLAEYVAVDPGDRRYPWAATMLNALGFLTLLLLAYTLHAAGWRVAYAVPVLGGMITLVVLRALYLQIPGHWRPVEAALVAMTALHPAAAWRYLPLSSLDYALLLMGITYAATLFTAHISEGHTPRESLGEPLVSLGLILAVMLWI